MRMRCAMCNFKLTLASANCFIPNLSRILLSKPFSYTILGHNRVYMMVSHLIFCFPAFVFGLIKIGFAVAFAFVIIVRMNARIAVFFEYLALAFAFQVLR